MKSSTWYDIFIKMLNKKYPQKAQLVKALSSLLLIERETAYRRLRKEVMFSAEELIKIATAWNISLDNIVGISSSQIPFKLQLSNYIDPPAVQLKHIQNIIQICNSPGMKYMEVSNKLPRSLTSGFPYIARFQLLKWMYQFVKEEKRILPYSKIFFPAKISGLVSGYYMAMKNMEKTTYVWDQMLFDFLVSDIRYFQSIYLISEEEKELIKNELHVFLDYMSKVATKGCWPETNNEVNLYISYINIDTNYNYYYSEKFKMCRVHAFQKSEIYTTDPIMVENFVAWMQLKKRSSILISKADDKSRIEFFTKQHQLVDSL